MSRRPWLGIRRESDVLAGQRLLGHDLPAFCGQVVDRDVRVNADHTAALRWQDISPERSGPADPSSPTNGAAVRTTPSRASSTTPRPGRWTSRGSACAPSKAEGVKAFDPLIAPFEVTDGLDDRRTPDERRHSDAARGLGELAVTIVPCPRGGPQPVGGGALGSAGFHAREHDAGDLASLPLLRRATACRTRHRYQSDIDVVTSPQCGYVASQPRGSARR